MLAEKRAEIVRYLRIALDHRIQAPDPRAGMQDIPKRNPRSLQCFDPDRIRRGHIELKKFSDDAPERIMAMCVVLGRVSEACPGMLPSTKTSAFLSSIGSKLWTSAIRD